MEAWREYLFLGVHRTAREDSPPIEPPGHANPYSRFRLAGFPSGLLKAAGLVLLTCNSYPKRNYRLPCLIDDQWGTAYCESTKRKPVESL